jgi:hypothetical protein
MRLGGAMVIEPRPQSTVTSARLGYRFAIARLRAPAVPSVVAYHGFPQLVLGGVTGVAEFSLSLFLDFLISAFPPIFWEMSWVALSVLPDFRIAGGRIFSSHLFSRLVDIIPRQYDIRLGRQVVANTWFAVNIYFSSSVRNSQVVDLESGSGRLGQLSLPGIGCAAGDSLQI